MPKAVAKPKSDLPAAIRAACEERLDIEIEHAGLWDKIAALDAELKELATQAGHTCIEYFPHKGRVSASGRKAPEYVGDSPEIDLQKFNAMRKTAREALIKKGIVVMAPNWKRADGGRVTVTPLKAAS